MTRTIVMCVCFLLNMMSVASLLDRRGEGKLNCISYSEPIFRSTSRTPQNPLFLNFKPFLNVFFNEAPLKPQIDAIYTPEPIELTDTSPILHKLYKATNNCTEDEGENEIYFTQESEEELIIEYDPEVTYPEIDIREDDTSAVEDFGKASSKEENVNSCEEDLDTLTEDETKSRTITITISYK